MKLAANWNWAHRFVHFGLLRTASLMVPGPLRTEWWREWRGEGCGSWHSPVLQDAV